MPARRNRYYRPITGRKRIIGASEGADDVDSVGGGLGGDGCLIALPGDLPVADVEDEVLGDLPLIDHFPGCEPDLVRVGEPPAGGLDGDLGEVVLGRGQQVLVRRNSPVVAIAI
jgi:hypothetical protein